MTDRLFPALALLLVLPLSAGVCSSDTSENPGETSEGGFTPSEDSSESNTDDFVQACLASTNWNEPMCECADGLSGETLSPLGREFVIAGMRGDEAATERLRSQLSFEDATQAGLFMVHAGSECGGASGGPPS